MRKALKLLLTFLGAVLMFCVFIFGMLGSAGYVSSLRILNDDFFPLFMFPTLIIGFIGAGLIFRNMDRNSPLALLIVIGVLLLAETAPVLAGWLNVRFSSAATQTHSLYVMRVGEQYGERWQCVVTHEKLGTFFFMVPRSLANAGSYVQITTRSGLLGFEWIERGPETSVPVYPPAPQSEPPKLEGDRLPVEAPR